MPHALITGASTGIGAALALELARRGWAVSLVARRGELLAQLADQVSAGGGKAAWAAADVTDRTQVEAAVATLVERLGPVDLLVANAGSGSPSRAVKADVDNWVGILRLNVEGVLYALGAVLPAMAARKSGHVAVVSSLAGFRGLPTHSAYSASKAAASAFFEGLRPELRASGIAVTTIHPGFVKTPLTDKNRFPMPFLVPVDKAARIVADGLEGRKAEINFPFPMVLVMKLARLFPNWLWDRLIVSFRMG